MKKVTYLFLLMLVPISCFARELTGMLVWPTKSILSFPVEGVIDQVKVNEGYGVRKGELLAQLDQKPFIFSTRKHQSKVAEVQPLLLDAQLEFSQAEELFERTVLSEMELQKTEAVLKGLQAKAAIEEADLKLAEWQQSQSKLIAPYDGVVIETNLVQGLVISHENKSDIRLVLGEKGVMQANVLYPYDELHNVAIGKSVNVIIGSDQYQGQLISI